MNIAEKIVRLKQDIDVAFAKGKDSQRIDFWREYQNWGNRRSYYCGFSGKGWDDVTYNPPYPIVTGVYANDAKQMFYYSDITSTKVDIVVNINQGTSDYLFGYCKKLKDIPLLDVTNYTGKYTGWFSNCDALENIKIKGTVKNSGLDFHWSKNLTAQSIDNIVRALSPDTSGLSVILPYDAWLTHASYYGAPNTAELWQSKANWKIEELPV